MKPKIFLPIILIAALILASTHAFTASESKNTQKMNSYDYTTNTTSPEPEQPPAKFLYHVWHFVFCDDDHERRLYEFHFKRIRTARHFCKLWCILARLLVIVSHLCVLGYAFKSVVLL